MTTKPPPMPAERSNLMIAAVDLLGRSGAIHTRFGYSDEDDGQPVVWYAVGVWLNGAEADAALDPITAMLRLCERVVTGGECTHCHKMTTFSIDADTTFDEQMAAFFGGCLYAYDPELRKFRRGCEGSDR